MGAWIIKFFNCIYKKQIFITIFFLNKKKIENKKAQKYNIWVVHLEEGPGQASPSPMHGPSWRTTFEYSFLNFSEQKTKQSEQNWVLSWLYLYQYLTFGYIDNLSQNTQFIHIEGPG